MSEWTRSRRKDQFYRKAKADGYSSRAAYKLIQLNQRHRLMHRGDRVLDLGCAPGGWSQAAREVVGPRGLVVGVDLEEIPPLGHVNVKFLAGDMMEDSIVERISAIQDKFDVVVSDASPSISGIWGRDHLLSADLARRALELCDLFLRQGGSIVVKVFQGEELDSLHRELKSRFSLAKRSKPEASRGESSEIYLVGKGYRGPLEEADGAQ